jgi:hypothetical protein
MVSPLFAVLSGFRVADCQALALLGEVALFALGLHESADEMGELFSLLLQWHANYLPSGPKALRRTYAHAAGPVKHPSLDPELTPPMHVQDRIFGS